MCLVESSRTYRWNDMVWGLAEGWWMFQDAGLRNPNSPLLSTSGWEAALAAIRQLDLRRVLELPSGSATAEPAQQPSSSSSGEP